MLSDPKFGSEPSCLAYLLQAEVAGDKIWSAEAGEDDRDDDPEADDAHDDGRPLGHGQVQLGPPGLLKRLQHLSRGSQEAIKVWQN